MTVCFSQLQAYTIDMSAFFNETFTHVMFEFVAAHMKRASKENNIFNSCLFSVNLEWEQRI